MFWVICSYFGSPVICKTPSSLNSLGLTNFVSHSFCCEFSGTNSCPMCWATSCLLMLLQTSQSYHHKILHSTSNCSCHHNTSSTVMCARSCARSCVPHAPGSLAVPFLTLNCSSSKSNMTFNYRHGVYFCVYYVVL